MLHEEGTYALPLVPFLHVDDLHLPVGVKFLPDQGACELVCFPGPVVNDGQQGMDVEPILRVGFFELAGVAENLPESLENLLQQALALTCLADFINHSDVADVSNLSRRCDWGAEEGLGATYGLVAKFPIGSTLPFSLVSYQGWGGLGCQLPGSLLVF